MYKELKDPQLRNVCRDFMQGKCERERCRYVHDSKLCKRYFKNGGSCKFKDNCRKNHFVTMDTPRHQRNDANNGHERNQPDQRQHKHQRRDEHQRGNADGRYHENQRNDANNSQRQHEQRQNEQQGQRRNENQRGNVDGRARRKRNTESFEPYNGEYDMRIVLDAGADGLSKEIGDNDVSLCPRVFEGYSKGELYEKLVKEIESTDIPMDQLLKLWHGNDKIEGTHLIVNDRTKWKDQCPTFNMVIERLVDYFGVRPEATRLNWYKDHKQFKPLHHDSAYVNPEKAKKQNITVAVSFGQTREIIFQHAKSRDMICVPQGDGEVYTFGNGINSTYRHGVQPGREVANEGDGRISVIIWGWKQPVVSSA